MIGKELFLYFKMKNSNKKGAERMLSIYWFVILALTAGGIYGMIYAFYIHPFDIREVEANILINNVADCISEKGVLKDFVLNEEGKVDENFKKDFLDKCGINFNVEDEHGWNDEKTGKNQYYLEVNFYDVNLNDLGSISAGEPIWKSDCKLKEKKEYQTLVKCANKRFYALDNYNQILIDILSIVRKTEKNVKT